MVGTELITDSEPTPIQDGWRSFRLCVARQKRVVMMPFETVTLEGRDAVIDGVAATLPSLVSGAVPSMRRKLEKQLRDFADGTEDPNKLLEKAPAAIRQLMRIRVVIDPQDHPPESDLLDEFDIKLPSTDKAVPQQAEDGTVTQLSLEVDVELLASRSQRIQVWLEPTVGCYLPTISVAPSSIYVTGRLRVWWDTSSGALQAGFVRPPVVSFTGDARAVGCQACPISGLLTRVLASTLANNDVEHPFAVPFKAPIALRLVNATAH